MYPDSHQPENQILVKAKKLKALTLDSTSALREAYEKGFPNSAPIAMPEKELISLRTQIGMAGFGFGG